MALLRDMVAEMLAPRTCVSCEEEGAWLCGACADRIASDPNTTCMGCGRLALHATTCERCRPNVPLACVVAAVRYDDASVQRIVHTVKYAPAADVAGAFVPLVDRFARTSSGQALREACGVEAVIVPVPLSRAHERSRGFNQSEVIAALLAERGFGVLAPQMLVRPRKWRSIVPQARLTKRERLENVRDAFAVRKGTALHGKRVLLVDDVVTTGATLIACARALRGAGARSVSAFALAREA